MPPTTLQIPRLNTRQHDFQDALRALRERLSPRSGEIVSEAGRQKTLEVFGEPLTPQQVVARICTEVRDQGLPALLHYCEKLDRAALRRETLRISDEELENAHAQADPQFLQTVRRIRDRILKFQRAILHHNVEVAISPELVLRQRYTPLERVGICVPGGAAAYPSTVLMTAVPALAAGVRQVVVVAPPTPFGAHHPAVLATCREIGIREVYRIGGAQGVAALAYGVDGVPPVDKIVGPGNLFVALAKKYVFGEVDIDSIAGPSEVVVLADASTRADFTAADLLAQAEHAPGASILITWHEPTLERTYHELQRQVALLSRCEVTVQSLEAYGALILVRDEAEACELTNQIAPEHLHVAVDDAERLLPRLRNAGATFLGNYSPVAIGDYAAGPSHVLPTGGTARWASGLSANHFLRSSSVIDCTPKGLDELRPDVQRLADVEGLTAHRASVDIRRPGGGGP
ncbi:MAG: histidinol dehydrogenase [Pirellulaceae bacterium]